MFKLLNRVFGAKPDAQIRARRTRRVRPAVEQLEDRTVLTVASITLSNGTLEVISNSVSAGLAVTFDVSNPRLLKITVKERLQLFNPPGTIITQTFDNNAVKRLVYYGARGADVWSGGSLSQPQELHAGSGGGILTGGKGADVLFAGSNTDLLQGGDGNDTLYGGTGVDDLSGGAGNDMLYAGTGFNQLFGGDGDDTFFGSGGASKFFGEGGNDTLNGGTGADTLDGGAGKNVLYVQSKNIVVNSTADDFFSGVKQGTRTPAELEQTGNLFARVIPAAGGPNAILVLNGPSDIGFQIRGNITTRTLPDGSYIFTVTGGTLESAVGNITLPGTVFGNTKAGSMGGVGIVNVFSLFMSLDTTATTGFGGVAKNMGLSLAGPATPFLQSWNIALGSTLGPNFNPAVPYLYKSFDPRTMSFEGTPIAVSGAGAAFVAIDPGDFSLTAIAGSDFALGVSMKGYIPFHPDRPVVGASGLLPSSSTPLRGNFLVKADLAWGKTPIRLKGEVVLNVGSLGGRQPILTSDMIAGLTRSANPLALDQLYSDGLAQFKIGFNGQVSIGYKVLGIGQTYPMGNGTLIYSNGAFSFAASSTSDPLAGTLAGNLVKFTNPTGAFTIQGHGTATTIDADFNAPSARVAGLNIQNVNVHFGTTRIGFAFTVANPIPGLGSSTFALSGSITPSNGNFDVSALQQFRFNAGVTHISGNVSIQFSYRNGVATFQAFLYGQIEPFSIGIGTISASFYGALVFNVSSSGVSISGWAVATADLGFIKFSIGFSFSNSGFTIDLPYPIPDLTVNF